MARESSGVIGSDVSRFFFARETKKRMMRKEMTSHECFRHNKCRKSHGMETDKSVLLHGYNTHIHHTTNHTIEVS